MNKQLSHPFKGGAVALISLIAFMVGCGSGSPVFLSFVDDQYQIEKVDNCSQIEQTEIIIEDLVLKLENSQVKAYKNNQVFWQTEDDWQVDHLLVADADNDGQDEIMITLWKQGSYGKDLPLWVEKNDENIEHHLFLYEYKDGEIVADWHSSSLSRPIQEIHVFDINQDGKNELVEIEGDYYNNQTLVSIWVWNEWWFENLWQSEAGNYNNLCVK